MLDQDSHQLVAAIDTQSDPTRVVPSETRPEIEIVVRKRPVAVTPNGTRRECPWLDVGSCCSVEVTSEENGYPIEAALQSEAGLGWRAAVSGTQIVRLIFDEPQKLRRIWLMFEELEYPRTQEFVLRSCSDNGNFQEIVRQQWNFSPTGSVREIEDYAVELSEVKVLEIIIVPDKSASEARASLRRLRLA